MNSFCVEQWEIWYTFSTYLKTHISNLEAVAKLLVDFEIADCSVMSNGETFCRTDKGVISGKTILELLATRRDLIELKSKMLETTPYGEVRDLLTKGWEQMNLEAIQGQISENLSILESEIKFLESKQGDNFRVFLTVFGLIASASFAKSVVSPFWKALDLWLPSNENWAELFLVSISAMLVTVLVLFLKRSIYR